MGEGQIDWSAINRRLGAINAAIEKGFSPSIEEKKRILRARADLLAVQTAGDDYADAVEVVEFMLADEHYGIESAYVREVYPLKDLTPLPCTPPFVLGLISVRGRIVSVIDVRKFFDLPSKGISSLSTVIILEGRNMEFGILADSILGVRKIDPMGIEPSLPTLKGKREEYLRGITADRLVLLHAGKILTDKNIVVYEEP